MTSFIALLSTQHKTRHIGRSRGVVRWRPKCDDQAVMISGGGLSPRSIGFLQLRLRSSPTLASFADDIRKAMQSNGSANIVGAALLRLDSARTN
eukprot:9468155-Pyramimonas_sp.AAC.1